MSVTGSLTALDLSYNSLEDEGLSAVCEAIQSNKETKLASLNFGDNGIGPVGANAVAAMVAVTGSLTALDLSYNKLKDESVSAVCQAIQSNKETKLASLNFHYNHIGPDGANAVAAIVAVTGGLTALDLSSNNLKDEGVSAVCEAIQSNKETKLTSLYFRYTGIGPVGANAVAAMVAVTGSLTKMRYVTPYLEQITLIGPTLTFEVRTLRDCLCTSLAFAFASSAFDAAPCAPPRAFPHAACLGALLPHKSCL